MSKRQYIDLSEILNTTIYPTLLSRGWHVGGLFPADGKAHSKDEIKVECPFCQHTALSYNLDRPVWRCFHCEEKGDWIAYLEQLEGWSFPQAVRELAEAAGVHLEDITPEQQEQHRQEVRRKALLEEVAIWSREQLWQQQGEAVLEYLRQERGLSDELIASMGLGAIPTSEALTYHLMDQGYSQEDMDQAGIGSRYWAEGAHKLLIPVTTGSGRIIGVKARIIQPHDHLPKYINSTGMKASQSTAGLALARREQTLYIVEGELDALLLTALGRPAMALSGKELHSQQQQILESWGVEEIILWLDNDRPGLEATKSIIRQLMSSPIDVYVANPPTGHKDPSDIYRDIGEDGLAGLLQDADHWPDWIANALALEYDLQTDRGMDRYLEKMLQLRGMVDDPIIQKRLLRGIVIATRFQEEELAHRLLEQEEKRANRQTEQRLRATAATVESLLEEGKRQEAEKALEKGLQSVKESRGVTLPEPYLQEEYQADLLRSGDGLSTGWPDSLDQAALIPEGALSFILARPSHGKTSLMLNLLYNQLREYPEKVFYFFTYEEARVDLITKLALLAVDMVVYEDRPAHNYRHFKQLIRPGRRPATPELQEKQRRAITQGVGPIMRMLQSGRLYIDDRSLKAEDLTSVIGQIGQQEEGAVIYLDYIQKLQLEDPGRLSRQQELGRISEGLRQQAVEHNLPIIAGAQSNREGENQEAPPSLDQMREAGDLEQDANLVLSLFNPLRGPAPEKYGGKDATVTDLQIAVRKQRGGSLSTNNPVRWHLPTLNMGGIIQESKDFTEI